MQMLDLAQDVVDVVNLHLAAEPLKSAVHVAVHPNDNAKKKSYLNTSIPPKNQQYVFNSHTKSTST